MVTLGDVLLFTYPGVEWTLEQPAPPEEPIEPHAVGFGRAAADHRGAREAQGQPERGAARSRQDGRFSGASKLVNITALIRPYSLPPRAESFSQSIDLYRVRSGDTCESQLRALQARQCRT